MFDYTVAASEGPYLPTIQLNLKQHGFVVGQVLLVPHSLQLYEIHLSGMDKTIRGKMVEIGKEGFKYIFNDISRLQKLIAYIPTTNRLAVRLAKRIGMKHEGTLTKSFDLDGQLVDQEIYGFNREDLCR